jgi:hypothetical protein
MVGLENIMSAGAQHALQDMVELEMYIVSQPQQAPWPMLPRRSKKPHQARKPYSNPVESSAAKELFGHGFIETTSNRTFVVSKSGYQFYEREMKPCSSTIIKGRE